MARYSRNPVVTGNHISDSGCFHSEHERKRLGTIDLRGAHGRHGRDGMSFHTASGRAGANGQRGGDASRSSPGNPGGHADIILFYGNRSDPNSFAIQGSASQGSTQIVTVNESLAINDDGYLFFECKGGSGGNGGRGGDGQPGTTGRRGRNATRFSRGGNGGPGGDGGNAGNPSDGGFAGDGGVVTLRVSEDDQGLLMLAKGNLLPGDIGFGGEPGRGGKGGPGGAGGSSYHWTETRTYRDANGNTRTRTVFKSNPGGFSGRRGRDGANSSYRAKDGQPGLPGRLRIIVQGPNGDAHYDSPYNLELVTFDIASEYSVIEPDSLVSLDNLRLRNCGGMPTPPNYKIRVYLESDRWITTPEADLVLQQSIEPGQEFTFADSGIRFRFADFCVDKPRARPFTLKHPVSPVSRMESGIGRPFRRFENAETVKVEFPVQLKAITCLNSLAPGESTRVIWAFTNVGTETFDHKLMHRAVQSHARYLGGDIQNEHIVFFDNENGLHDLTTSPMQLPIRDLKPGETRVVECRIGVKDDPLVQPYHGFAMGADLDLQRPNSSERSEEYRRVDYRRVFIRVAEKYQRDDGSRFLLIANHRTTNRDIELWTQMADYFGSSLDVWDVSYYGFFDLVRDVEQDESLLEQWRGMTIIVPNNYYETAAGRTLAFEQLAKSQFLHAAADHDINFYIVGDSHTGGADALQKSLIPVSDQKTPKQAESQKEFLKQIHRWSKYVERTGSVVGGDTRDIHDIADASLGAVHEIDINKRTILFQPDRKWLQREAKKLQRKLSKIDPLHRWVVVHRYDTGDSDTSTGLFKKRQIGKLEVRRSLDSSKGSAVLYEVDAIDMVGDEFITSKANKHGMFLALKFEDKVDRFIRLVSERVFPRFKEEYIDRPLTDEEIAEIGKELLDSILVDIFNEQKTARECKTWGAGGVESLMPKLNYLAERSLNYGVTIDYMEKHPETMDLLVQLISHIRHIANESRTVFDLAIFPTAFFKRSRAVSKHMRNRADRIATSIFGKKLTWWDKWTDSSDDYDPFGGTRKKSARGLRRDIADQALEGYLSKLPQGKSSLKRYTVAQDHPGLTYDPELLAEESRVMPGHVYDQLVAEEFAQDVFRKETEQAVKAQRSDLLVPLQKPKTIPVQTRTVSTTN